MSNSKQSMIPEARQALDKFKMEAANEVGVNLKDGYNGHLTSREAGSIGGQMVNYVCPGRSENISTFLRDDRCKFGHKKEYVYIAGISG